MLPPSFKSHYSVINAGAQSFLYLPRCKLHVSVLYEILLQSYFLLLTFAIDAMDSIDATDAMDATTRHATDAIDAMDSIDAIDAMDARDA